MTACDTHVVEFRGDFACWSRPEMKVERYSYPCPTPSAARGALEAIYFKPQFFWQVTRIELLSMPSYIALRRNEVKEKISQRDVKSWMDGKAEPQPLLADADKSITGTDQKGRTQRQTMAVRKPHFRVHAKIVPRPGNESMQKAFDQQFIRRARQGKCFHQPSLGCREFVAFFDYVENPQDGPPPVDYGQDLGWMLYDVFNLREDNHAKLAKKNGWKKIVPSVCVFRAEIKGGVLEVPDYDSDEVRKSATKEVT